MTRTSTTRKSDSRRQEVRRKRNEQRGSLWRKMSQKINPAVLLIWVIFYVAAVAILLSGQEIMPWQLHQKPNSDLRARVTFTIVDQTRTEQAREARRILEPNVYTANPTPLKSIHGKLAELLELAKSSAEDTATFKKQAEIKGWPLDDAAIAALKEFSGKKQADSYTRCVESLINALAQHYIVEKATDPTRTEAPPSAVLQKNGEPDLWIPTTQLLYVTDRPSVEKEVREIVSRTIPKELHKPVFRVVLQTFSGPTNTNEPSPLWLYDAAKTAQRIKEAVEGVEVETITVERGQLLVEAGAELTNTHLALLRHEHEAYLNAVKTEPVLHRKRLVCQFGIATLFLILTIGLATYITAYQGRIIQKPARTMGLVGLLVLMIGISRLSEQAQWPKEYSVGVVVMAAALLTIAYNQRFAFGTSGVLAIMVTLAARADLGLFLTLAVPMGITVFTLKEVRTRNKIIGVGVLAGLDTPTTSIAVGLINGNDFAHHLRYHGMAAAAAALGAGFVVQGILHYFERLFGIATSMTLLEWCDASRPLLRRLAQEASGTYSHSVILSQIAEEAAEAIGARGLLVRVGALYHDIGKMQKPDYFVENQEARMNRHDRLAPTMSLLIIVGHVKDGVEMARAYTLPRALHQFIAEHHGTTLVRYFHHAASEAAAKNNKTKGRHDRQVAESEFRYPGPKPRSKESAILMLCDSCEGAVRALSEPTVGRIETIVHQIIMDRLNDEQFDNCDITMRELNVVEQSLVKSLCAIHHGRIKYPKSGREQDKAPEGEDKSRPDKTEPPAPADERPEQTPEVARQP